MAGARAPLLEVTGLAKAFGQNAVLRSAEVGRAALGDTAVPVPTWRGLVSYQAGSRATLTVRDKEGGESSDSTVVTVGPRAATLAVETPATLDSASAVLSARFGDDTDATSGQLGGRSVILGIGSSTCTVSRGPSR